MKKLLSLLLPIFLLSLIGCNGGNGKMARMESWTTNANSELDVAIPEEAAADKSEDNHAIEISKKLIKNGSISFRTSNLVKTKSFIIDAMNKLGGYISNENTSAEGKRNTISLTVRIPSNNFESLLQAIESENSKIDYRNVYVEDVTQDFIDIEARLSTKKELEQKYIGLLQNAKTVSDILEIEKQMGELRSDIESYEGRLRYLSKQVNHSTLNITFYDHNQNFGFAGKFENGLKSGWTNMLWVIVALANLWAILLFFIIAWVVAATLYKRRVRRKQKHNQRDY